MLISPSKCSALESDLIQVLGLFFRQHPFRLPPHDAREADDGIERRAQFVTHVRQEGALGFVRLFRGRPRFLRLLEQAGIFDGNRGLL